jgi:plastocyanin
MSRSALLLVIAVAAALAASPAASVAAGAGHTVNDYAVASTFVLGSLSAQAPSNAVKILKGDTVVWTNLDPISHDVTFKDRSYMLRTPGAQARRTFRKTGAFSYRCTIHPGMTGLVYVSDTASY